MMASYDGHTPKRQRTDMDGRSYGEPTYYNNSGSFTAPPMKMERVRGPVDDEKPNHILLMTILNPAYPITVDVINTICTPSGKVLRIVIFKKNGVQAMVEFDSIESAKRAKESLNGADIYSGCCTLKIEYAKPSRLNVYKNDSESWDYTNPNLGGGKGSAAPPLLGQPRGYGGEGVYRGMYMCGGPGETPGYSGIGDDGYNGGYGDRAYERFDAYRTDLDNPAARPNAPAYGMGGPAPAPQTMNQGSVMMVYGLNQEKMNCDRLFNLFCLYGNVVRIKFLKSKEGCAMVQMGDPLSVERCVTNLNHSFYFSSKMQLGFSKQAFLNDVMQPYELPDGTPSFKDYMGNRNNRFTNPEAANKNRIQAPSKVLHFFNTPPAITEDEMKKHFEEQGAPSPSTVKLFPSKSEKSSSGLLQFEDVSLALEALVLCNHMSINNPTGKYPYILKLCFSSSGVRM